VMTTMLNSREFWVASAQRSKFKTPFEYVVSAVRATGLNVEDTKFLNRQIAGLGMPLYACVTPDGYKNTREAWLNENSTIQRINFATRLASGRGISKNPQPINSVNLDRTITPYLSARTQSKITATPPNLQSALMLGSPDFMYR
jgi:uncharacterized protein (DUF1800 family)